MELNKISFCDKNSYNVCNNDEKAKIITKLSNKWNIHINPTKYISLTEKVNIKNLTKIPYLISLKSIGNEYFLYLTKINGQNNCFFIDKKIVNGYSQPRIILVRYRFSDDLFENDTLLEGELVKTDKDWKFIISDVLVVSGKKITIPLLKRLTIIRNILFNKYVYDPYFEVCILKMKKYLPFDKKNINNLIVYINSLNYLTKGLVFNPVYINNSSYILLFNQKYKIYKTKSNKTSSKISKKKNKKVCFLMNKTVTPGIFQLSCLKGGFIYKHSIARIDGLECIDFIKKNFKNNSKLLVTCRYQSDFNKFVPYELSKNKKPDDFNTIIQITKEKF